MKTNLKRIFAIGLTSLILIGTNVSADERPVELDGRFMALQDEVPALLVKMEEVRGKLYSLDTPSSEKKELANQLTNLQVEFINLQSELSLLNDFKQADYDKAVKNGDFSKTVEDYPELRVTYDEKAGTVESGEITTTLTNQNEVSVSQSKITLNEDKPVADQLVTDESSTDESSTDTKTNDTSSKQLQFEAKRVTTEAKQVTKEKKSKTIIYLLLAAGSLLAIGGSAYGLRKKKLKD